MIGAPGQGNNTGVTRVNSRSAWESESARAETFFHTFIPDAASGVDGASFHYHTWGSTRRGVDSKKRRTNNVKLAAQSLNDFVRGLAIELGAAVQGHWTVSKQG